MTLEVTQPLGVSRFYCCLLVNENIGKRGVYLSSFYLWHSGILKNDTENKNGHQNGLSRIISHAEHSSWPWFLAVIPLCWCPWLLCREVLARLWAVLSHLILQAPWILPSILQFLLIRPEAQMTCKQTNNNSALWYWGAHQFSVIPCSRVSIHYRVQMFWKQAMKNCYLLKELAICHLPVAEWLSKLYVVYAVSAGLREVWVWEKGDREGTAS